MTLYTDCYDLHVRSGLTRVFVHHEECEHVCVMYVQSVKNQIYLCVCCVSGALFTLLCVAVVGRLRASSSSSRCGSSRGGVAERVAPVHALPGAEAHAGARSGADVRGCVRQPGEVLRLGGRHGEAH